MRDWTNVGLLAVMAVAVSVGAGCEMRGAPKAQRAAAPKPSVAAAPSPAEPLSSPQTEVALPSPQPVNADAVATVQPPPAATVETPAPEAPVEKPRPHAVTPPPARVEPPSTAQPPPILTPGRNRIRVIESPSERQRVLTQVEQRRRETEDRIARARTRSLSDVEKETLTRIQAFLEQASAALRRNDYQEADALSSRALLLSRDLVRE